jgi:hypothetical protein
MSPRHSVPTLEFASFRRENVMLILLNLGVMLGLLGLHFVFRPCSGPCPWRAPWRWGRGSSRNWASWR